MPITKHKYKIKMNTKNKKRKVHNLVTRDCVYAGTCLIDRGLGLGVRVSVKNQGQGQGTDLISRGQIYHDVYPY